MPKHLPRLSRKSEKETSANRRSHMPGKKHPLRAAASGIAAGSRFWTVAAATLIIGAMAVPTAEAKSPGSRYCFHGYCHRVGTLSQTDTLVGWRGYVIASYYDSCHRDPLNPCGLTSSGAVFRADLPDNAASPLLPDGTVILAYNPKTGDASVLRITNAGPYSGERKLDVSRAAADKLGFRKSGVTGLVISVLQSPTKAEANYVGRRVYPKVPGHLGKFGTVDIAIETAKERMGINDTSEQATGETGEAVEMAALGDVPVPKPQLAVSPSLAKELVILRTPPQPVNREVQLIEEPKAVSRADFLKQQSLAQSETTQDAPADARQ
jgi:rare lipoprotein A